MAKELKGFVFTTKDVEEDEHSLELHLPFIYKALKD
jgi:predicted class III extradiol MEMO1 family dioxygenase